MSAAAQAQAAALSRITAGSSSGGAGSSRDPVPPSAELPAELANLSLLDPAALNPPASAPSPQPSQQRLSPPLTMEFPLSSENPPFEFEQVWIYLSEETTGNLGDFLYSRSGLDYIHAVDARMNALRDLFAQMDPKTLRKQSKTSWDHFQQELAAATDAFEQQYKAMLVEPDTQPGAEIPPYVTYMDFVPELDVPLWNKAWVSLVFFQIQMNRNDATGYEIHAALRAFDFQRGDLINLMTQRYQFQLHRTRNLNKMILGTDEFIYGWDSILPSADVPNSVLDRIMTQASVTDANGNRAPAMYLVDGSNVFNAYDPIAWGKDLYRDRLGQHGPTFVIMKLDTFNYKIDNPTWARGKALVYDALQELHGGWPVYIISVWCKSPEDGSYPALQVFSKQRKGRGRNPDRVESKCVAMLAPGVELTSLRPLPPHANHELCEYDDILLCKLQDYLVETHPDVGGHANATFVTDEGTGGFQKEERYLRATDGTLAQISDAFAFGFYQLS